MVKNYRFIDFGPFRIDRDDNTVTKNGREVCQPNGKRMMPRAVGILIFLIENRDKTIRDTDVVDLLPCSSQERRKADLARYIHRLRACLGEEYRKFIRTTPGGYKFVGDVYLTGGFEVAIETSRATAATGGTTSAKTATDKKSKDLVLSIDGIILNAVGELICQRAKPEIIQRCSGSYQRSLEDFAFALVYGPKMAAKWGGPKATKPTTQEPPAQKRPPEPAESLISLLPDGLYDFENLDEDLRDGVLLKNPEDREQIKSYLACIAQCMYDPRFVSLCKDLLVREAEMFLRDDPSLFQVQRDPSEYRFGKNYYRHEKLDAAVILGKPAMDILLSFLPETPESAKVKKPQKYVMAARVEFASRVMLMHLTTMYEFEKNSERHDCWRVPYALRSAVTQQLTKTKKQRRLRHILVRNALLSALPEASGLEKRILLVDGLADLRKRSPFREVREMLQELYLVTLRADEGAEARAANLIDEIFKAGCAPKNEGEQFLVAHNSVLRSFAAPNAEEYESHLYKMFPELGPPPVQVGTLIL